MSELDQAWNAFDDALFDLNELLGEKIMPRTRKTKAICPSCDHPLAERTHPQDKNLILHCQNCGWHTPMQPDPAQTDAPQGSQEVEARQ